MTATTIETGAEGVAWELADLYAGGDDPRLEADLAEARRAAGEFRGRFRGRLAELGAPELEQAIAELERIGSLLTRVQTFAHLHFATDTADPPRGALVARTQEEGAAIETETLFFRLEWNALSDERAQELLAEPPLGRYRHFLEALRRFRPHELSEPEERILAEKSVSGSAAWGRLYEELLSAMRARLDGEEISLEETFARLYSPEREVRRTAAEAITEALEPGLRTRTFAFNTLLQDKATDDRLRGYEHWISTRNLANEISDEAVEALVSAVTARYDIPQRWYRLKAQLLGLPRLADYDRFAPISTDATEPTPWSEAERIVRDAYASFSGEAGRIVGDFFDRRWIDAPVRPDKAHGAFCATLVPEVHPYVLMNYTGDRRSVLVLAHELGHGLHGVLAQPQGLLNAETPLTLAETASVFGEALTFKRLLEAEDDPRRRLDLLAGRVEDAIATVHRQIAMNRYEDAVHAARRGGGELAPAELARLWEESQRALLGDSVELSPGYGTWWSYVPHFVVAPGYVYAYAYGYLFSLAIFRRWEREGSSLVEPYLDLLRAGGSQAPEELARLVGLDLTDPAMWSDGLEGVDEVLAEAEALASELA